MCVGVHVCVYVYGVLSFGSTLHVKLFYTHPLIYSCPQKQVMYSIIILPTNNK